MLNILNVLYVVLGVVLLFGAAIFVHEYGHFWMARKRGLKVEAFAIGFGPKIYSWTRDGIEYSLRWIPAGGFVKLPQMITSETLEGEKKTDAPIPPASPFSKILVAFAGPFMNVVFAFAIATVLCVVGLPVPVNPSVIGYVEPDSEEGKLGINKGDRIVMVNNRPVSTWEQVHEITVLAPTNILPVVIQRDGRQTTYHLKATVNEVVGLKILNLDPEDHPIINRVLPNMPAEKAGLKPKDKIISFAGIPVFSQMQAAELINKRSEPTEIVVERDGVKHTFSVIPKLDKSLKKPLYRLGIEWMPALTQYKVQYPGSPWAQVVKVWDRTIDTIAALINSKKTGVGAKDLAGPVGILTLLAVQVNTDYRLALSFLVLLNINLAILNLLPIPVLDGGHILMAIIEKIRGRSLSVKFVEYTTTAFAVLLLSFMAYVTFADVQRFRSGLFQGLFKRDTQIEKQQTGPTPSPSPATNR